MGEARKKYEPPKVMRLGGGSSASGSVACQPGSNADTFCSAGNSTSGFCQADGNYPLGVCSGDGNHWYG